MEITHDKIIEKAAQNTAENREFVMATVVDAINGTPGRSGFKMLIYHDGSSEGTVGGGKVELIVINEAQQIFIEKKNRFLEFELTDEGTGMLCGGKAKIFMEYFKPKRTAYLFGAGHLCRSLLPILKSVSFNVFVIDNREDYADKQKLPLADKVICGDYTQYIKKMKPSQDDSVIIFTHGHKNDYEILLEVCKRNLDLKYIGMIASRSKAKNNLMKLAENGISKDMINSLHTPIGLNIAKTTTQEIAISITAELLAVYNNIIEIRSCSRI